MEATASDLLSFILDLLADSEKAEAFADDTSGALAAAGLSDIHCADVDALTPLIANAAPGAVAISGGGGTPGEMITHLVKNVAVSNYSSQDLHQELWAEGDINQAFASDGGLAVGGEFAPHDPVVVGDGNIVASDEATAAGRDVIQNNGDGNLTLGGDQINNNAENTGNTVGGNQNNAENTGNATDNSTHIGGNNNAAENTGNTTIHDESTYVGGNQNNAENTGNDNSVGGDYWEDGSNVGGIGNTDDNSTNVSVGDIDLSDNSDNSTTVGGDQNNAENTGNTTIHDESTTIGDISVDLSDNSDHSTHIGGNNNAAENTGNDNSVTVGDISVDLSDNSDHSTTIGDIDLSDNSDNSVTVGDISVDLSDNSDNSVGGDYWEDGSNVGGIGNTDNRNSGNDSSSTVVISDSLNEDNSISVGTIAVDLSEDNSVGGDYWEDGSNVGGIGNDSSDYSDNSDHRDYSDNSTNYDNRDYSDNSDNSVGGDSWEEGSNVGGNGNTVVNDNSTTSVEVDSSTTVEDNSYSYEGDVYESGSVGGDYYGGAAEPAPTAAQNDYDYSWGE